MAAYNKQAWSSGLFFILNATNISNARGQGKPMSTYHITNYMYNIYCVTYTDKFKVKIVAIAYKQEKKRGGVVC